MPGLDFDTHLGLLPLTRDSPKHQPQSKKVKRRDIELDPLILAAAFASGPHVTRNHHSHDLFPAVGDPRAQGSWDWTKWTGEDASSVKQDPKRRSYNSQQAPRSQRLRALGLPVDPEPQIEIVTSPTTQARPPRSNIVPNERACYVYTITVGC
jgi:GTP cyclohydrolase II